MTYQEVVEAARPKLGSYCKACPVCNGKACANTIPGPGAKGLGDTAVRNYQKWQEIRVNMDCLVKAGPIDTSLELFGRTYQYPFFAGPVGAVQLHYGKEYTDMTYNEVMVSACAENGIMAFTGDGVNPDQTIAAAEAIKKSGGIGIPVIKPWNKDLIDEKMALVKAAGASAVAMDVDASGLPFLKNLTPPAGAKSAEELKEIIRDAGLPFVVKGIMTVAGARKAMQAGAAGIVVSNHGGRVLDGCPSTAEVLPEIVKAVRAESDMKILVDGGIRSGLDVFRALAMGADGVLICRPFVTAIYGAGAEGIQTYIQKIGSELKDIMEMCGARSLADINSEMIRL
ncbi:MAG: alpha-hydroxy-acid oxidizing protein [Lachnospiraceae bacterium]|nr:alpha-hydroxy-acid oxidizing protein [Lachnospiraceae bacterium]